MSIRPISKQRNFCKKRKYLSNKFSNPVNTIYMYMISSFSTYDISNCQLAKKVQNQNKYFFESSCFFVSLRQVNQEAPLKWRQSRPKKEKKKRLGLTSLTFFVQSNSDYEGKQILEGGL
jgi:hypothetical protein